MDEESDEERQDNPQPPRRRRPNPLERFMHAHAVENLIPFIPNEDNEALDDDDSDNDSRSRSEHSALETPPPVNFDPRTAAEHEYLFRQDQIDETATSGLLAEGQSHVLPEIILDIVALPGQMVPIFAYQPSIRNAMKYAIDNGTCVALRTCFAGGFREHNHNGYEEGVREGSLGSTHSEYGTVLRVERFADDGYVMKVNAVARQCCRFVNETRTLNGIVMAAVEVMGECVLPKLEDAFCPDELRKLSKKQKLIVCDRICGISPFTSTSMDTNKKCSKLGEIMKMWYADDKIQACLELGSVSFGYWVASHLPVNLKTKYLFLAERSVDVRIAMLLQTAEEITDLICNCGAKIASLHTIIKMNPEGPASHFVNNAGYIHEMITVQAAENFDYQGNPSSQFSWFPGYKWQIITCSECHSHLGWEFTSRRYLPPKFYGITRRAVSQRDHVADLPSQ